MSQEGIDSQARMKRKLYKESGRKFNVDQVRLAMEVADVDMDTDLYPESEYGPAAKIVNVLGMDETDQGIRKDLDRFAKCKGLTTSIND